MTDLFHTKYGGATRAPGLTSLRRCFHFFFFKNKKKKNQNEKIERSQNVLLALGGEENILSIEAKESRLNIVLKDSSLLNEEALKSLGVSSIVRMSKKTTLVIGRENYQKK